MTINKEKTGTKLVVKIEGRLDTTTAPELEAAVGEEIPSVTELVLDFEKLVYVSSAGLRALLSFQKKIAGKGSMKLINVCSDVMEVFEITGFSDILTIE